MESKRNRAGWLTWMLAFLPRVESESTRQIGETMAKAAMERGEFLQCLALDR
jgi:hypothetical protein